MQEIKAPMTNLQMELLKLFSLNLREEDLKEITMLIIKFLNDKLQEEGNKIWEEHSNFNKTAINKPNEE